MNKPQTTVLLKHYLKALKLPTMHAECDKVAAALPGTMPIRITA